MDILVKFLNKYNFIRLSVSISPPVIIHCVPGAGKTSLIREIIREDSRFVAYTFGVPDQPNLEGRYIQSVPREFPKDKFVLLDEYTLGEFETCPLAAFGDPIQSNKKSTLQAHFICRFSQRFGSHTANFLSGLGFEVQAEGEDIVTVADIFVHEPEGQVIYFEKDIGKLLCDHNVEARTISEIVGQTFECVTFVTAENQPIIDPAATFQCLTRHRRKLLILCPNATYSSS